MANGAATVRERFDTLGKQIKADWSARSLAVAALLLPLTLNRTLRTCHSARTAADLNRATVAF
jgi:hypothetical protein